MKKNPIVAVTGHRPEKLGGYDTPNPIYDVVTEAIDKALIRLQPDYVYCGMALGVDQWAAQLCVMNEIPFVATIPFLDFDSKWPPESRQRLIDLCSLAKETYVVTPTRTYNPSLLQARNEYMVRNADVVLAVWNGSSGGTANCVKYARGIGKQVILVDIPSDIWESAAVQEERIKNRRQQIMQDRAQTQAFANSALVEAAENAITPNFVFNRPPAESNKFAKRRVVEEVKKVDVLKPRRLIEL